MFRKLFLVGLLIAAAVLIGAFWLNTNYYLHLPEFLPQHETIVLGQNRFVPGSQAALRVIVRDSHDARPLPDAAIQISLQEQNKPPVPLYSGTTDAAGNVNTAFSIPDNLAPDQKLIVETTSSLGHDRVEQAIKIERDYRILLTTDKPLYQPGQIIHLRALALSAFDRRPIANQPLDITIADGKGNKVFHKALTTSDYGVASTDFQLANEVNTGPYKITAQLGTTISEKTVTVEHYVLPKFAIKLSTERSFYQPGQQARGTLSASYFFGKPVSNGAVTLEGITFDVERKTAFNIHGITDANGNFDFEFDVPKYLAGSDLDNGLGHVYVQASVLDEAQHTESANLSVAVSAKPIVIRAIPESGQFRSGVENILYVLTSTPDGAPIETDLAIVVRNAQQPIKAQTDRYGLAEVRLTPTDPRLSLSIQANAANGSGAVQDFQFTGDPNVASILLRPDKPIYRVGETMQLAILTTEPNGPLYLDIVREGQTVSTRSTVIKDGRADIAVDLTPDLDGTLELHAYKVFKDGHISRDTRLVLVDAAADLNIALKTDRAVYRPGERASLDIAVSGQNGSGAQSAIGLAVVDESVFALAEQDPGFAKLYFMLEQELLQPKYDLHGFSLAGSLTKPADDVATRNAQLETARASLAQAAPQQVSFGLSVNTHETVQPRITQMQSAYFGKLNDTLYALAEVLPWLIILMTGSALNERKRLGLSLGLAFLVSPLVCALSFSIRGDAMIAFVAIAALMLLGIMLSAWVRKDRLLKWTVVMMLVYVLIGSVIVYLSQQPAAKSSFGSQIWALLGLGLFLLALVMLSIDAMAGANINKALNTLLMLILIIATGCSAAMPAGTPAPKAMLAVPAPTSVPQQVAEKAAASQSGAAEPPRLRQYFPETMLWLPDAVTDQNGQLHVDVPIADSITTWRMTALASTRDGRLGSTTSGLRVFQDFFIDLDMPTALTVGDEIAIPVGVYNYLPNPQTVRLEVAPADWFELRDEPTKEMNIKANDVGVMYFRIRAKAFGTQPFKVTAYGTQLSDAIQKMVRVSPNGKRFANTQSDRLAANTTIQRTLSFPAQAITGTQQISVKVYPGVVSQVVEGLDSILRMPNGCFEQTSSTTYPNVLVLDYLRAANKTSPETQLKAEQYINTGYQRLTTFEVPGGGFSLWGRAPADRMLTAYGLQEFSDMRRVHDVDPDVIKRAAEWLLAQQQADGSWENDQGLVHEGTWQALKNNRLPVTAYIVWSLIDAGYGNDPRTQRGLSYVREHAVEAEDAYVVALIANALVAADRAATPESAVATLSANTQTILDRLAEMATRNKGTATWQSGIATFMGGKGQTGSIETTALAALAFLRANSQPDIATEALTMLLQQKDEGGTWHTTQATVLALKALIQSVRTGSEKVNADVTVKLDGGEARTLKVTPENFDVTQLLTFNDLAASHNHTIEISASGEGSLTYQIANSYYLPWTAAPASAEKAGPVSINVKYDRAQLQVNDSVNVSVTVSLNQPDGHAESALIDLGVPPGFTVQAEDLDAWVAKFKDMPADYGGAVIQRYEIAGQQVIVYVGNLNGKQPLSFSYRLKAKFPLVAQTPASAAYDYYNPDVSGEAAPQTLTVNQ